MHAETSEENIHATLYLQTEPVVATDPNVLLHFPALPLPSFSKTPSMPHSSKSAPRKLFVQEYEGERERIEERSNKMCQNIVN